MLKLDSAYSFIVVIIITLTWGSSLLFLNPLPWYGREQNLNINPLYLKLRYISQVTYLRLLNEIQSCDHMTNKWQLNLIVHEKANIVLNALVNIIIWLNSIGGPKVQNYT